MTSGQKEYDDLTVIKGIGPVRQRWLKESLNVHSLKDLAALSVEEIETRLQAEGQIASLSEIESWLEQARKLADPVETSVEKATAEESTANPSAITAEVGANSPGGRDGWKPIASYVVEFQARTIEGQTEEMRTVVHHVEADSGNSWPGLETEQLSQWMLEQASESAEPEPDGVRIAEVRAFIPPNAEAPIAVVRAQEPLVGTIRAGQSFALGAVFELPGKAELAEAIERTTYEAQFFVRDMATGVRTSLGETVRGTLTAGKTSYSARLPVATLQAGTYRLSVLLTIQSSPPGAAYLEVPVLQVA